MPLAAVNLDGSTESESNTRVTEQSSRCTRVNAGVKVDVGAVLVGARETVLGAERVTRGWAEVVDLDNDAVAGVGELVAARVGLGGQSPAGTTGWTGACAWSDTKLVLGDGGAVAGCASGVETTGSGGSVAVGGTKRVASTVLGEGGLERARSWWAGALGWSNRGGGGLGSGSLGSGSLGGGSLGGGSGGWGATATAAWKALGVVGVGDDTVAARCAGGGAGVADTTTLAVDGNWACGVSRGAKGGEDDDLGEHVEGGGCSGKN